jgi:hypothetical protein
VALAGMQARALSSCSQARGLVARLSARGLTAVGRAQDGFVVPLRRAFSASASTAPEKLPYGAPFTNSIRLTPRPPMGGSGAIEGADEYTLAFTVPDLTSASCVVLGRDKLDYIAAKAARAVGAGRCAWVLNGRTVTAPADLTLNSAFGKCAELDIDGVRYSLNGGSFLDVTGRASKRSLGRSYIYVGVGGLLVLAGSLALFRAIVPEDQQRKF